MVIGPNNLLNIIILRINKLNVLKYVKKGKV